MSGGNGKWVFGGRGRGRRTKLRTTATTVVGEAWPLGLDMMGKFLFSFLFFGLDWIEIGLDWSGPSAVGGVAVTGVSLQLYVAQVARYLMVAEREESDDNDSSSSKDDEIR